MKVMIGTLPPGGVKKITKNSRALKVNLGDKFSIFISILLCVKNTPVYFSLCYFGFKVV